MEENERKPIRHIKVAVPCDNPRCGGHAVFSLEPLEKLEGRCDACNQLYWLSLDFDSPVYLHKPGVYNLQIPTELAESSYEDDDDDVDLYDDGENDDNIYMDDYDEPSEEEMSEPMNYVEEVDYDRD